MRHVYRRPFLHGRARGFVASFLPVPSAPQTVVIGSASVSASEQPLNAEQRVSLGRATMTVSAQALSVIGSEIVNIGSAAVLVSGRALSVLARLAVNTKRFFISLNDING